MSYEQRKTLESVIAGDNTPTLSNLEILSNIKLIDQITSVAGQNTPLGKIAKEELKYLNAGMDAIANVEVFRDKFGVGFEAAKSVSGLIKAHHSEQVYKETMDKFLRKHAVSEPSMDFSRTTSKRMGSGW